MTEQSFSDRNLQRLLDHQRLRWHAGDQVGLADANNHLREEVQAREQAVTALENSMDVTRDRALELQKTALADGDQVRLEVANMMIKKAMGQEVTPPTEATDQSLPRFSGP